MQTASVVKIFDERPDALDQMSRAYISSRFSVFMKLSQLGDG
jgi:hypothetical protein